MKMRNEQVDILEELERLDAWLDGSEPGEKPIDVLRARGIEFPDDATLDDAALHERLWVVIRSMAEIGMYLDSTDHLSDRELYRYLVASALVEETCLPGSADGGWHISPIGGFSEEDIQVYLRYYADEEERESFKRDGEQLPPREKPQCDRDRLLPQHGVSSGSDA